MSLAKKYILSGSLALPVVAYITTWLYKSATWPYKNFNAGDFGVWLPLVDKKLLQGLDTLADSLVSDIIISPADGTIGRLTGSTTSQHYAMDGKINAVDIMLPETDLEHAYNVARSLDVFSGIGVYPDWDPYKGMHLDTRPDRSVNDPAQWGAIDDDNGNQVYVTLTQALEVASG